MNANFGIIAPLEKKVKGGKRFRNEAYAQRSLEIVDEFVGQLRNERIETE